MARSTLLQTGEQPADTTKGHGTAALGPSDTSDSGSDVVGGPGLFDDPGIGLDTGTTEDPEGSSYRNAGQDMGDTNLDSDSDSGGSGERETAGREPSVRDSNDIYPDHVEGLFSDDDDGGAVDPDTLAREVDSATDQTDIDLGSRR